MSNPRNRTFLKVFAIGILYGLFIVFIAVCSDTVRAKAVAAPPTATPTVVAAQSNSNSSSTDNTIPIINIVLTAINTVLMFLYVGFTLYIARKTAESVAVTQKSLDLARDQMVKTQEQSEETLRASKEQSEAAIAAIREQIVASENQAREALHNQHKPVIVPVNTNPLPYSNNAITSTLEMQNKGTGAAINTWGMLSFKGGHFKYYFSRLYFLVPSEREHISFNMNASALFPSNEFEGYSVYPEDENGISPDARLMITYSDVFDNNYLVVFDLSEELEWQRKIFEPVKERLDRKVIKRGTSQQNANHLPTISSGS